MRTPLYDKHVERGARMVDFAGWRMPLYYESQLDEHHAVRKSAGLFDVSHMRIAEVAGPGAEPFLQRLLANDVARLTEVGAALYSCLLGEDGGILDDLIVYRMGPQSFRLISNASTRDKLRAWISMQSRAYELDVSERGDLALLALQGPEAGRVLREALPAAAPLSSALAPFSSSEADGCFIARTGYTGEDGFEIALPAELAGAVWDRALAAGATACGLGARDTLRLEAGLNLYGSDMDETTTPFECGLAWTVSLLGMRQFIGRAALERQLAAGVARERAGLVLEGPGIMRNKMRVLTVRGEGVITSGSYSPSLGRSIALARVPAGASGWAELDLRGQPRRARIVKPPFVKNGRSRVPD